jgi:hypothetical protein
MLPAAGDDATILTQGLQGQVEFQRAHLKQFELRIDNQSKNK